MLISAWDFDNWLAHTKSSTWHDAETASTTTEHIVGLWLSILIRHVRKVPEACPACGSRRLSPQRAHDPDEPEAEYERPICAKCSWTGEPIRITQVPVAPEAPRPPPDSDCTIPTVPMTGGGRKPES